MLSAFGNFQNWRDGLLTVLYSLWFLSLLLCVCVCMYVSKGPTSLFILSWGFPGGSVVKNKLPSRRCEFNSWVGKIPWRRKWLLTLVYLLGEFHGQRSLRNYSPWGHRVRYDWATNTFTYICIYMCVCVCVCACISWSVYSWLQYSRLEMYGTGTEGALSL